MKYLAQFLWAKWEEILVAGIWTPLVIAAISTTDPAMIILSVVGGGACRVLDRYYKPYRAAVVSSFAM
jgi:hypothetical protein